MPIAAESALSRRQARRRQVRRRRLLALAALGGIGLVSFGAVSLFGGRGGSGSTASASAPAPQLPLGGRTIFPHYRVVAYYGAPQDTALGALGIGSPAAAAEQLTSQAADYERLRRPVLPAFELIATVATASPGADGSYRSRQSAALISQYLEAARQARALLVLDIQPGRADFMDEVRVYRRFLEEPDVGLALDPEWSMGPGEVPGHVIGSTSAAKVNQVSAYVDAIVRRRNLPQKLFIVHEFEEGMIRNKGRLKQRPGLATVLNVDGYGYPDAKRSKYDYFTHESPGFHHGFKLFYEEDTRNGSRIMSPYDVMALRPRPDVIVYE